MVNLLDFEDISYRDDFRKSHTILPDRNPELFYEFKSKQDLNEFITDLYKRTLKQMQRGN